MFNSVKKETLYKELELIPAMVSQPKNTGLGMIANYFKKIWQAFTDAMAVDYEPRITPMIDHDGNSWWEVYDPIACRTFYMATEEEVLCWLDQRHNVY